MAAKHLKEKEKAMISKSEMLDQVNELMDTMTAERLALTEKIASLEKQLQEEKQAYKATPTQPEHPSVANQSLDSSLTATGVTTSNLATLKRRLEKERLTMKSLQETVNTLSQYISSGKQALTNKLKFSQEKTESCELALKIQCKENAKLKSELSRLQSAIVSIKNKNKELCSSLEETKTRYRKTRNALLALRGQVARDKKEQDKVPHTAPSIFARKQGDESSNPMTSTPRGNSVAQRRADAEMKRKDELLVSYGKHLSHRDTHCASVEQKLSKVEDHLDKQKEKCIRLEKNLNMKTEECSSMHCRLTNTEMRLHQVEKKYADVTRNLETKIVEFEKQFHQSRDELKELRYQLRTNENALELSQHQLRQEQAQTKKLVETSQAVVEGLKAQLEQSKRKHRSDVTHLKRSLATERQAAQKELEMMKDVSAQRCTELAHEVWMLKSQLGSDDLHT